MNEQLLLKFVLAKLFPGDAHIGVDPTRNRLHISDLITNLELHNIPFPQRALHHLLSRFLILLKCSTLASQSLSKRSPSNPSDVEIRS